MTNNALFKTAELARATGGVWHGLHDRPVGMLELNTDSRSICPGQCFVPLRGERFDGHAFLAAAAASGASAALTEPGVPAPAGLPVLEVPDTLRAYQQLAAFHRARMKTLRVASVTGSVGKTSVKEMLRAIFSEAAGAGAVLYTAGNTNNQIGVAQNLLRLTAEHQFAVIEMGTNHPGEIAPLTAMARPDVALVNSIGACHLEFLGDLDGVAREKSTIFAGLKPGAGIAVYPAECAGHAILGQAARAFRHIAFGEYPAADAEVTGEYLSGSLTGSRIRLHFRAGGATEDFDWTLTGAHQAVNAAAAAAVAYSLGIEPAVIAVGLSKTTLPGKRMNRVELAGTVWINDAYNANPVSMKSTLRSLRAGLTPQSGPLLLVLGDMLELGNDAIRYHRELLGEVRSEFAGLPVFLWLLGPRFAAALTECGTIPAAWRHFDTLEALQDALAQFRRPGMTIFLKSSNSLGLCKVEPC